MPTGIEELGLYALIAYALLRKPTSEAPPDNPPPDNPPPTNGIYLSNEEINSIKSKINANQEPWKSAYSDLISRSDILLSQSITSISGDLNTGNSGHYQAAIGASKLVRDLALAYRLSGQTKYADKAIQQINAWCVNSNTRMIPRYKWVSGDNGSINITITMPGILYGANLLYGYSGWNSSDKTTFMNWCRDFLTNISALGFGNCSDFTSSRTQNYDSWRMEFQLALAAITDNSSNVNVCIDKFKTFIIPCQQDSNGSFYQERNRTLNGRQMAIFYSLYNLKAWVHFAEIARHRGIDIYSYKTNGKGIELALDFHAPYAVSSSGWPYSNAGSPCEDYSGNPKGGNGDIYELAYKWKQKTSYKNAINVCSGRPRYDIRTTGPVTLTHGI